MDLGHTVFDHSHHADLLPKFRSCEVNLFRDQSLGSCNIFYHYVSVLQLLPELLV